MMAETAAGGPDLALSNAEEGAATTNTVAAAAAATGAAAATTTTTATSNRPLSRRRAFRAFSLIGLRSRRFVGFLLMLCVFSLVHNGALINWVLVAWGFFGALLFVSCIWLARIVHAFASRGGAVRRRQRIPHAALEARLQLRHPGIELGRLRLLLVDRDFTGEDYQALLDLDDNNEVPSTVGASEGEIRRNPSFLIKEPPADSVAKPQSCSICLYPFKPRERCIDPWLRQNAICPVCKFPAVG